MFEKYQFEGVYIAIQAVLTLYAQGLHFAMTLSETINMNVNFITQNTFKDSVKIFVYLDKIHCLFQIF